METKKPNSLITYSECNGSSALNPMTLNELFQNVYESKQPIVKQLLYPGVYIFAGSPKVGKSFFVAQIGYKVSRGEPLWSGYDVRAGSVLYFPLENTKARIQKRMADMFGVEGSDNFYIITAEDIENIGGLEENLEWQIELFVKKHQNLRLVIVDTLQKIRGKRGSSYNNDYDVIGRMKKLADKYTICILLVHHTTKQKKLDSFESISGSNGLLGCADGAFVMEKESRRSLNATIDVVGRDIPDQRLLLVKDDKSLIWNLEECLKDEFEEPSNPILESVAELINSKYPKWEGTATQLCNVIRSDVAPNILTKKLNVYANRLNREFCVHYSRKAKHEGRVITLTYSPQPGSQQKLGSCVVENTTPQVDMTTDSGADTICEVIRDDSKIVQPTVVNVDSGQVVDDKVVVRECKCNDCDSCKDKSAPPSAVVATSSGVDTANKAVCVDERDGCDDENAISSTVAVDGFDVNTTDEMACVDERNACDDHNASSITVAADDSRMDTAGTRVCEDKSDNQKNLNL